MQNRGTIVQYGSGKPGEENSEAFECSLFNELGLADPSIAFLPFHPLPPSDNDWTRFLEIYRPLTRGPIGLIELHPYQVQPDVRELEHKLSLARIIVLGSGLVEPYVAAIALSGLDRVLRRLHRAGTVLIGYSAGSLALGSEFRHYQTGGELVEFLEELLDTEMKDIPLDAAVEAFCSAFDPPPPKDRLLEVILKRRGLTSEGVEDEEKFLREVQSKAYCPGLNLVPGIAAYPHYGAPFQCTLPMLVRLHADHPQTLHIGLPNATALVSTFAQESPRMIVRGRPRHRPIQWIDAQEVLHSSSDGDEIPAPVAGFQRRP